MNIKLKSLLLPIHSNLSFIDLISVATGRSDKGSRGVLDQVWMKHVALRARMHSGIRQLGPVQVPEWDLWGVGHYFVYHADEINAFHDQALVSN